VADVDKSLVQAARRGDADAWDALFRAHQLPLYVFVLKMVRHDTTALDIHPYNPATKLACSPSLHRIRIIMPTSTPDPIPSPGEPRPGFPKRFCNALFSWRTARRVLIGLGVLITLIAVVYTIENIRGKRAWNRFEAELKAAGESLDPEDLKPTPVPDEQNMAMTPLLKPLLDYKLVTDDQGDRQIWANEAAKLHLENDFKLPVVEARRFSDRHRGLLTELAKWQTAIRTDTNNVIPAERLSATIATPNPDPSSNSTISYDTNFAAPEILLSLEKYSAELAELHRAANLRHAQFPVHLHEGFSALLPHIQVLRSFSAIAELKAIAHLAEKDPDAALTELSLINRFADSIRPERLLISGLVQIAIREQVQRLTWEGIGRKVWRDEHLQEIETLLRKVDLAADYHFAVRGERTLSINALWSHRNRLNGLSASSEGAIGSLMAWAPTGFYYQNLVSMGRMYQEFALVCVDSEKGRFHLAKAESGQRALMARAGRFSPYNILARMVFPAWGRAVERFAEAQVNTDFARIACALERHRHRHGKLPASLNELSPTFLPEVPKDPTNGEAYHYEVDEQNFTLYSPGANYGDDGGTRVWKNDEDRRPDPQQGDWVWTSKVTTEPE
jgi:hypothetical protein